ncbi:MAG: EAL domain-containing protein, partial [Nitriliruptorales bacterium]|nr:EAL domain-containing protein [Nitriliruptorales bacterium]
LKDELRYRVEHDALTGLANRALFTERLKQAMADGGTVALLYLDLDDFKAVNDTLGHEAGDQLLRHMSRRLTNCLRAADLPARLGGDEFAVLLSAPANSEIAQTVADRVLDSFSQPVSVGGNELFVRVSIGIALSRDADSPSSLIRNADVAMYHAKRARKGRAALFHPRMHSAHAERLSLRNALLQGLDADQFRVVYQPLYDLATGSVVGKEALLRWDHPELGSVGPEQFIALAEEIGIGLALGELVLHKATHQLAVCQRRFSPGLVVTVNLSAFEFKDERIVDIVAEAIESSGIRPGSLVLELTERDVMDNTELSLERLLALRRLGVQLALDDFGTGYSSLAYLRRFPFDIIKIAKEFIDGITQIGDEGHLVRAIIELVHALDMHPIAEGIETRQQKLKLLEWGCHIGQGWLFSPALSPEELSEVLSNADVTSLRIAAPQPTPGVSTRRGLPAR